MPNTEITTFLSELKDLLERYNAEIYCPCADYTVIKINNYDGVYEDYHQGVSADDCDNWLKEIQKESKSSAQIR